MIEIKELYYSYNDEKMAEIPAIVGINAFFNEGEFIAIIGHNGCGKSTLAKLLNALLLPKKGDIRVNGIDTKNYEKLWDIRKLCGMVFQNPDNQIVTTVVDEEVAFGPENLGIAPGEIEKRVDEALKAVGIQDKKSKSTNLLSGGQKQRLAIAGIIAMHPKYIIMDEATSMLDPRGRKEVLKIVRKLNLEEGLTIIYITHSMEEASLADRVIVMEQGKIVMSGKPGDVFCNVEELKKLRLDVPPMTELAYRLNKKGADIPLSILKVDEMADVLEEKINSKNKLNQNG